ncbi:MAG: SO_0444 family Cu/Zn efflux transporter [Elusimicrobiota bacterium]
MTGTISTVAAGFWATLCQMAPYLLLGFAVAGILSVLVSPETVERHLGGRLRPIWAVVKATLFGIPLPLCSCGVIPVAASLRRHGASRGAATSFLISTPQTGVDSILVTYSLLGPVFAVFRPLAAFAGGIIGGAAVSAFGEDGDAGAPAASAACTDSCCAGPRRGKLLDALRYGFVALPKDIGSAMFIGLLVAGFISALVPPQYFHELLGPMEGGVGGAGASLASMSVMMLVGIPVYVCATASVPIAAALIAKGISPGAALVFLMTGPATNAATISTIWKVMGKRTAAIYLATVAGTAFASGLILDLAFPGVGALVAEHASHAETGPLATVSGVILLAVMAPAVMPRRLSRYLWGAKSAAEGVKMAGENTGEVMALTVKGMTCAHCKSSVTRALSECEGVASVEVDLDAGRAVVRGDRLEASRLIAAVEGLGFTAAAEEAA